MEAREFIEHLCGMGMTQQQIAERTGIPQPTISKVLNGKVEDVLSANYRKLQALYEEKTKPAPDHAGARQSEAERRNTEQARMLRRALVTRDGPSREKRNAR